MSETKVPPAIQAMVDRLEDGFARGAEGYTDVIGHIATLTPELTKHVPISVVAKKDGTTYSVQIAAYFTIDLAEWTDPSPGRAPGDTGNAAAYVAMGRDEEGRVMSENEPWECHEGVTRRGEYQPCELPAVGYRIDPEEGEPYPVCKRHHRPPFPATPATEQEAGQ